MSRRLEGEMPMLALLFFVIAVQLLALIIMPEFVASGNRVFENPESAANPFLYLFLILGFTLFLLLALKLKQGWILSGFIMISIAASVYYVLATFLSPLLALLPTLAVLLLLRFYPEWYIVDAFGVLVCAGISALFGVSMTPFPAILLLIILAIYDAISVYRTRHMVSLAEGVIGIKAPLLFVVPRSKGYSFRQDQHLSGDGRKGAYFLGLGDAIIPSILVISASWAIEAPKILGISLPALGAMLGTYAGFLALMMTSREKPQAGLPFLNSGTILGFLAGCLLAGANPF
jgi:presenilin-like A22 family membrane protease